MLGLAQDLVHANSFASLPCLTLLNHVGISLPNESQINPRYYISVEAAHSLSLTTTKLIDHPRIKYFVHEVIDNARDPAFEELPQEDCSLAKVKWCPDEPDVGDKCAMIEDALKIIDKVFDVFEKKRHGTYQDDAW